MEILVVYSEYSKKCKNFIEQLQSDSIIDSNKINKLCIDSPAIRNAILKQENVILKKVPAVLVKSKDMVDVYEGKTAFEWLQSFSDQLYEQLYKQQEEAELFAQQQQEEIEERIRVEAEAIAQEKIKTTQIQQTGQSSPSSQPKTSIKQQARMIEQDRRQEIVFDDQPKADFSDTHVSQVKSDTSSNSSRVSDIVKNMERERELEMANIKKTLSPM